MGQNGARRERTPGADERADLARRCGEAVELATHGSGTRLGGEETEAVAGPKLAEGEEDSVDYGKCTNVVRELLIETAHDEADDSLEKEAGDLSQCHYEY